ncbi:hypothetical protein [Terriglobus saanensis]|uniref:Uncharacterized protein n=1 Tax=Terriglobus saanensis (strain ATCC BAA-1853 / DSM 23119 / SP1PR4) TaxID=401053 RepID=E8UZ10_TERSS|nr:hypothetical protein [Terriglobus saanensis]ADV80955.1 hypothetical protein AciPR4_0114 [Terriglobus saanensis SP1PR4]
MNTKTQVIISDLAKMLGVHVRKINMRDPNVFHRERGSIAEDPEILSFTEAVRFECESFKAEIRGNGSYLVLELKAALNGGTWSVNAPDQITLTRRVQNVFAGDIGSLFAVGARLSPEAEQIIQQEAFQSLLKELKLGPHESLHFYKNAVTYYALSVDTAKFLERMNFICRFVAGIAQPKKTLQTIDLPRPFAELNDCAQEWAISDDAERAGAIEAASTEKLRRLVEKIDPMVREINAYLDTHSGEKEAVLASLAETASEAKLALEQEDRAHHDRK